MSYHQLSPLAKIRRAMPPAIPPLLKDLSAIEWTAEKGREGSLNKEAIEPLFPHTFGKPMLHAKAGSLKKLSPLRVGVVFSGGQAAGGHNVIAGLYDAGFELFGFLGGPTGIVQGKMKELKKDEVDAYRNMGGFHMIGSGRGKIETQADLASALKVCTESNLDGLVVIGGDDSNTNAAILAEYFVAHGSMICVIGVPKTIDGDLQNKHIPISFGFDTACKTYSEMIGNLGRDALSAKKYMHFVKLMGRSASHIALECALSTGANYTFIGEELLERGDTLEKVVSDLTDFVCERAKIGKNYGIILIPEGVVEFIPDIKVLIAELSRSLAQSASPTLSAAASHTFSILPKSIQSQLMLDRDPHGNVQLSHIETEKLLSTMVEEELKKRQFKGSFSPVHHFFGYEGRAGMPSNFDANYCYALGRVAASLIFNKMTGYICAIGNLEKGVEKWTISAASITSLLCIEERKGKLKPVICKALVETSGEPFKKFAKIREKLKYEDLYLDPGPIQFFGPSEIVDSVPHIL